MYRYSPFDTFSQLWGAIFPIFFYLVLVLLVFTIIKDELVNGVQIINNQF